MLKHKAGLLFRKWGIAIGKKLEDILLQEKAQYENNKTALLFDDKSLEYMYQGTHVFLVLYMYPCMIGTCQLYLHPVEDGGLSLLDTPICSW